jgi:hypothetical protein
MPFRYSVQDFVVQARKNGRSRQPLILGATSRACANVLAISGQSPVLQVPVTDLFAL